MRIVFMGTPEFAVPSLRAVVGAGFEVVAVYTKPDQPVGRGRKIAIPPVKAAALALGLPVWQPASLRPADEVDRLSALAPDCVIVAAYGLILRSNVINIPRFGILNVHASLLPRWRGAAPIPAAILAGDAKTGVTIMQIDPGLDTGPMLRKAAIPIADDDTTGTLTAKLADLGASLLVETMRDWFAGRIVPEAQNDALATIAPRITAADALLDWTLTNIALARRVRAYNPEPGAYTFWQGKRLNVLAATPVESPGGDPGAVFPIGRSGLGVVCGEGALRLDYVQLEGGKAVFASAFRAGLRGALPDSVG